MGGGLWAHYLTAISGANFYFTKSFDIVEISIIGGMFSLSGSILGAAFFTIVPEFLSPLENGLKVAGIQFPTMFGLSNIIMAVLLIVLIIFRRQGLMGNSEIILDSWFSPKTYLSPFRKEGVPLSGTGFSQFVPTQTEKGWDKEFPLIAFASGQVHRNYSVMREVTT